MEEIVKTKKVVRYGKERELKLTKEDVERIKHIADVVKLNGYGEKTFLEKIRYDYREEWKDEALEIFNQTSAEVKVGTPATENLYSDRRAKTVVEVINPRKIVVAENKTKCNDWYTSDYEILDEIEERMGREVFTLRKGGGWYAEGQPKKFGSVSLTLGYRHHFIDSSYQYG